MTVSSLSTESPVRADEDIVARLFAEVFDLPSVGVDDDFFQLGGDSLIGQNLMTAVEERFGVALTLSTLLVAPTPRLFAPEIAMQTAGARKQSTAEHELPRHLIVVHDSGAPPTLFLVHGNTGDSTAPRDLAEAFRGHPFYAFRAPGLEDGEEILTLMDEFVNNYLSIIQRVSGDTPIVLLAHCGGTAIAYEMAQRLATKGRTLFGLVLIDPVFDPNIAPYLFSSGLNLTMAQAKWRQRLPSLQQALAAEPPKTRARRVDCVTAGIEATAGLYTPKPYGGPTLLIYTEEGKAALLNPQRGYQTFVRNLEAVPLSATHDEMFTVAGAEVGAAVNKFIDRLMRSQ